MIKRSMMDRRSFGRSVVTTAAMTVGTSLIGGSRAYAQPTPSQAWTELSALSRDANQLGLGVPVITVPAEGKAEYNEIFPAIVDFIDHLEDKTTAVAPGAAVDALLARARALQRSLSKAERSPRQRSDAEGSAGLGLAWLISPAKAQVKSNETRFREYHDGYLKLFDTCSPRAEKQSDVDWYVNKLISDKYRGQYQQVENAVCVPWYFVGVVHALEAGLNFQGHLHNGDPLNSPTVNEPPNRPPNWSPPGTWIDSAKDALEIEHFTNHTDWSLAATLFRWEAFNGFRSRELHATNSPYLWSFSNHYERGKFVADNVWSEDTVSKQCGAAVILKALVARGIVKFG